MKKLFSLLFVSLLFFTACSDDDNDRHEPETAILSLNDFNLSDGIETKGGKYWKDTYNENVNITSQIFKFSHSADSQWNTWDGFTVSNSSDNSNYNSNPTEWVRNQWTCVAKGGYDGQGTPFMIAYIPSGYGMNGSDYQDGFSENKYTTWIKLTDGNNKYKALGMYVTNLSWAYYSVTEGNQFANKFEKGDYFVLRAYGVKNGVINKTPVEFYMADYRTDNKINSKWEWMDLKALGEVDYIFFLMETTDFSEFNGVKYPNTPTYFCMDKLTVEKVE